MDQGAEGHPITPAGREVLNVYVLRENKQSWVSFSFIYSLRAKLAIFTNTQYLFLMKLPARKLKR